MTKANEPGQVRKEAAAVGVSGVRVRFPSPSVFSSCVFGSLNKLFTEMIKLFTEMIKLFTEMIKLFTEMIKLFTEMIKLFTEMIKPFTKMVLDGISGSCA